jgi:hypothetical protein
VVVAKPYDRPVGCVTCNAHPADICDITEEIDDDPKWCCEICDAVWYEVVGSGVVTIIDEGELP